MAQLAAVAMTPRIVTSYGWRWVPYIYGAITGGFMLVWQLFAANAPRHVAAQLLQDRKRGKAKTVEWRIFRVGAAPAPPPPRRNRRAWRTLWLCGSGLAAAAAAAASAAYRLWIAYSWAPATPTA